MKEEGSGIAIYEVISSIVIWVGAIIAGIILAKGRYDFNWGLFFGIVGGGFVAGGLNLGLAKIIWLLVDIKNSLIDIKNKPQNKGSNELDSKNAHKTVQVSNHSENVKEKEHATYANPGRDPRFVRPADVENRIAIEKSLFDKGMITEEEYNARVAKIEKMLQ